MQVMPFFYLLLGLVALPFATRLLLSGVDFFRERMGRWLYSLLLTMGAVLPELAMGLFCSYTYHPPQLIASSLAASCMFNILVAIPLLTRHTPVVFSLRSRQIPLTILFVIVSLVAYILLVDTIFQDAVVDRLTLGDGILLLTFLPLFVLLLPRKRLQVCEDERREEEANYSLHFLPPIARIVCGLIFIAVGAWGAVFGAVELMFGFHLPIDKVGVLFISFITAIPELTLVLHIQDKKHRTLHAELVQSSILNIVLVLGLVAALGGVVAYSYMTTDYLFLFLGALALMLFLVIGKGWKIERHEGVILLLLYLSFFVFVLFREEVLYLF